RHLRLRRLYRLSRARVRHEVADRVGRDREADADVAGLATGGVGAGDLRVDAEHMTAAVEERAAGVAGVDRRVGLDHIVDRRAIRRLGLAAGGRDDAAGEGVVETKRIADLVGRLADLDLRRIAKRERIERLAAG